MKRRLRNCLIAAGLAVAVTVVPTATAAHAETRTAGAQALAFDWTSLVISVASYVFGGGSSDSPSLQAAVDQIIAAVESSKNDIIAHTDLIAAADVQACARAHTIEFADIDNMSKTVLQLWAQNATSCATLATAYVNTVTTPQAVDNIGRVLPSLFAIVVAARAKSGLTNGINLVIQDQIRSYEAVVTKLTPTDCTKRRARDPGYPVEKWWECTAYTGAVGSSDSVTGDLREPNRAQAEDNATLNTSRPVAKAALPQLRALGV
jgi:hypothetical protein